MLEGNKRQSEYADPKNTPIEWYDFGGETYVETIEGKKTIALNQVCKGKYYFKTYEVEGDLRGDTLVGISEEEENKLAEQFHKEIEEKEMSTLQCPSCGAIKKISLPQGAKTTGAQPLDA